MEMLGYSASDLVQHVERQFVKGMGWDNIDKWQVDHIIPVSTAETVGNVIALNQLSNLRPMWSNYNNAKKDRRETLL